jgi:hypothetical protein
VGIIEKVNALRSSKNLIGYTLVFLAASLSLVQIVGATTTNFTMQSGEEATYPVDLVVEDRVLIQFTVIGETDNTVLFSIVFPNGTVRDFGKLGTFGCTFVVEVEGRCTLRFANNQQGSKVVALNYEVKHYIFGMPQMKFMVILIVLISIVGIAVFAFLSKPY